MEEITSTTIVPISVYCFFLAMFFLSMGINIILNNSASTLATNIILWLPVTISVIFSFGLVYVGIGFLNLQRLSWKLLFFWLAICVSCISSCILAYFVLLAIGINPITTYFQLDKVPQVWWYSLMAVFLSAIIVLYYLTHEDVVSAFGGLGTLISPF